MIEILEGTHEIINYKNTLGVRMFHNKEMEDYPEHWHTSIEMIMPLKGSYRVITGSTVTELDEGEIIIINAGVLHSLQAPEEGERIIFQFSDFLLYSVKEMETMLMFLPPVLKLSSDNDPHRLYSFVKKNFEHIILEHDQANPFFAAVIYAKILEIFVFIGRNTAKRRLEHLEIEGNLSPLKKKQHMEIIMDVCDYLNQHCQEQISLEDAAERSGFSKFYFSRIFKQCMNMTFYDYLSQKRISKAEELLHHTSQSITEIALNVGFSSISTFNRVFKTVNRCSPSEYRTKKWKYQK